MELSNRLKAVANLVSQDVSLADVGTDHGYVPIYLMKTGKISKAIAMDVNAGPLKRAKDHIIEQDVSIETRLSDGVASLQVGEVECVVVAGMGGALTIHILEEGRQIFQTLKEFVLQPQSEIKKVREYLFHNGYSIVEEDMIFEDGKFYPMMKVVKGESEAYNAMELCFGKVLLKKQHPVLKQFLEKEYAKKNNIMNTLKKEKGTHIEIRIKEIEDEVEVIQDALQRYYQ